MLYEATVNTPGYLPEADEPALFETVREAWEYLADERREAEDAAWEADLETAEGYSATVNTLEQFSRGQFEPSLGASDDDGTGVVYGTTPGYDGDHDLGKAYSVTVAEPIDVWLRIPEGEEQSESEANTWRIDGGFRVKWYHTAVGVVSHRDFDTYEDARKWLESEGFADYSS